MSEHGKQELKDPLAPEKAVPMAQVAASAAPAAAEIPPSAAPDTLQPAPATAEASVAPAATEMPTGSPQPEQKSKNRFGGDDHIAPHQ